MASIAISSMNLENFKNLALNQPLKFGNLNILIGPNSSGKTNLINLLRFLKDATLQTDSGELGMTGFDRATLRLGANQILDRQIPTPANVRFCFGFPQEKGEQENILDLQITVQGGSHKVIISKESLYQLISGKVDPFIFYQMHDIRSGLGNVSVYREDEPGKSLFRPQENVPVDELSLVVIPRLLESSDVPPDQTPVYEWRRKLLDGISSWRFYNANAMNLEAIRFSEPKLGPGDLFLSQTGENLALVMENLIQSDIEFEDVLNNALREIIPWSHRARAVRSGRLSLVVEWHLKPPGQNPEQYYLTDMSDGTVRMLCWACVLLSPRLPELIVIEEPEIGVHPAWMRILAHWIKAASRQTQVFVSTHSPDLLDHFTNDHFEDVLVMQKDYAKKNRFTPVRLQKNQLQEQIGLGWQLGDLYRVGDPGIGGWPW